MACSHSVSQSNSNDLMTSTYGAILSTHNKQNLVNRSLLNYSRLESDASKATNSP